MGINWPTTVVVVAIVGAATVLGATHVISADWIERTFTALIGLTVGHALGFLQGRRTNNG